MSKSVKVQYYALLREERGQSEDTITTESDTAADLYTELRNKHGFSLEAGQLRVAVNAEFAGWDAPLNEGDTVVFVPPVAGG